MWTKTNSNDLKMNEEDPFEDDGIEGSSIENYYNAAQFEIDMGKDNSDFLKNRMEYLKVQLNDMMEHNMKWFIQIR